MQVFGKVLNDKELEELEIISEEVSLNVNPTVPGTELDIYPWLRFVSPPSKRSYDRLVKTTNRTINFFEKKTNATRVICLKKYDGGFTLTFSHISKLLQ